MRYIAVGGLLLACTNTLASAQNTSGNANGQGPQSAAAATKPASDTTAPPAKKPKKVWTNDEISSAGGPDAISVVGNSKAQSGRSGAKPGTNFSAPAGQIASYRDRLRQLNGQLEATDKQILDLRSFNGNNSSASGGINMSHRYTTTSVDDQVKALEEKKKQLQAQIDAIEDQARKNGVEPGQLR